jgi:ribonucleoside-diphosphate reductase alpha chain
MEAVEKDGEYDIINPRTKQPMRKLGARKVFEHIVDLAWTNGEPGIIFLASCAPPPAFSTMSSR